MSSFLSSITTKSIWVLYIFAIVFGVMLVNYALKLALNVLAKKLEKTKNPWDDAFIESVRTPLRVLVWVVGIGFAATVVDNLYAKGTDLSPYVANIRTFSVIFIIAWFLLRLASQVENNIKTIKENEDKDFDHTTIEAIGKLLRISIVITAALIAMQYFGIPISGVLTFGGIGGIAVGFAARDLLANFFGALMIYMDRPFKVGDWIRSPDRNIEGTVEYIGWRLTRIRTFDKRPLYVPNSIFTGISVENPSRMLNRRIKETIGIRYDDASKMANVVARVKSMLQHHDEIDQSQTMIVNFNAFAPSSLDFFIYTFTKTTNWIRYHEIKQDVMLKIIEIVESEGAECAFPTSTLHIPDVVNIDIKEVKKRTTKKTTTKKTAAKKKTSKKTTAKSKTEPDQYQRQFNNEDNSFKNEADGNDDGGGE